ncbi:AzlD domain-containing protein [Deinococcus sp. SM5_A1]|uniref:AzlD domain-containing protein n=1 Tax=Deinococcus sp. SM5_A1 TaxID=3379094 RepID=UPI00385EFAAB
MNIWLLILGVGLGSVMLRASFLVLLRDRKLPESPTLSLGLVPAAVLAALIVPDLLYARGTDVFDPFSPRLAAGLLAAAVAWKTRNLLLTLVVGRSLLLILS